MKMNSYVNDYTFVYIITDLEI